MYYMYVFLSVLPFFRKSVLKKSNVKIFSRITKKSGITPFKPRIRKQVSRRPTILDARVKIFQNKKRLGLQNKSPLLKETVLDARLKIERRRNKVTFLFSYRVRL